MNTRILLFFVVCGIVACSREQDLPSPQNSNSTPTAKAHSEQMSASTALPPSIADAVKTIKTEPDYELKIKALKELSKTYNEEACAEMVEHLQHQIDQLPSALSKEAGYDEATYYRLSYMSVLIKEIRKMDFPAGNQAITEVMEIMRKRYTGQPQGDRWIRIFTSGLNNTAEDVKNGLYPKQATPADQAMPQLPK